jgi:hypothetical protein
LALTLADDCNFLFAIAFVALKSLDVLCGRLRELQEEILVCRGLAGVVIDVYVTFYILDV